MNTFVTAVFTGVSIFLAMQIYDIITHSQRAHVK